MKISKIKELIGIDVRSLALFRIGLASLLLVDLFIRVQDLSVHYSDEGLLPRSVLVDYFMEGWNVSLHLISGKWQIQLFFFIVQALSALALLLGFYTRIATIASWFLLISLQTRNPLVLQGGDIVLRMLLFWSMFLPLGSFWSLDQCSKNKRAVPLQVVSAASFALLIQICFIYWFSIFFKSDGSWRHEGTAVWYALSNELFATSIGLYLLQFPLLLKGLTFATFYLEALGPFFAFSPILTGPLRSATAITFILFHLIALNLTMTLGIFPYVCAIGWIVFLPTGLWDRILRSWKRINIPFLTRQSPGVERSKVPQHLKSNTQSLPPWRASFLSNTLAIFFLTYVFLWNTRTLNIPILPPELEGIGQLTRVDQYWNMFAPYPLRSDGWFVIPAKLRNGKEVDLFTDGVSVSWERPKGNLSSLYKNDRWKSFMMNLIFDEENSASLASFADYLGYQWNSIHPYEENILALDIVFMSKINEIDKIPQNFHKVILWNQRFY